MVAKNEEMKVKQERKSYRNKEIKPGDGEAGYGIEGKGSGERRRRRREGEGDGKSESDIRVVRSELLNSRSPLTRLHRHWHQVRLRVHPLEWACSSSNHHDALMCVWTFPRSCKYRSVVTDCLVNVLTYASESGWIRRKQGDCSAWTLGRTYGAYSIIFLSTVVNLAILWILHESNKCTIDKYQWISETHILPFHSS